MTLVLIFSLIISLTLMIVGANYLVDSSTNLAKKYHVSEFLIGALIVGVGTSLPELTVSTYGAMQDNANVAIGNVIGSNIFNILGIIGLTALIFPITPHIKEIKNDITFFIASALLITILTFIPSTNIISQWDGLILLAFFFLYIYNSFENKPISTITQNNNKHIKLSTIIPQLIGGLTLLIISSKFFVDSSVMLA